MRRVFILSLTLLTILPHIVHSKSTRSKVAVVTGANKGIGYEIIKGLCERYNGHVYLTSRNEKLGKEAVNKLKQLGLHPYYHQLDITDQSSIQRFRDYINATEGGIDILINNAGVGNLFLRGTATQQQVEDTINVNYFSLIKVSEALFPLLRRNARVINVSSLVGTLSHISSRELRQKLGSRTLTTNQLSALMNQYINSAKQRKLAQDGWPLNSDSPYVVSKIGVSALTFIQQRNADLDPEDRNVSVNCVHPGYVATDLTEYRGVLTAEQGASAPLYLALENHGHRGVFLSNNLKVVDWYGAV